MAANATDAMASASFTSPVTGVPVLSDALYLRPAVDIFPHLGFVLFYYGIVIPVAYVGNLFTFIIVCKQTTQRVPDTLIGGLALNDVLTAIVVFTPSIIASIRGEYFNSRVFCEFSAVTVVWYIYTTFAIIVLINVDRWIAITKPFLYKRLDFTPEKIKAIIGVQGLFCLLLASTPLAMYPVRLKAGWYCALTDDSLPSNTSQSNAVREIVFITIILLVVGIIILVACNIGIAYELNRTKTGLSDAGAKDKERKKKFAKLMAVVAILFLMTWLPNLIANVACLYGVDRCEEFEFWAMRIVNIGVAVNPIVYGVMKKTYRRGYLYLFRLSIYYVTCTLIPRPTDEEEIFDLRESARRRRSLMPVKVKPTLPSVEKLPEISDPSECSA